MTQTITPEFSRPVVVERLGPRETVVTIEADVGERAALARRFDIPAVESLSAKVRLKPMTGGLVRLKANFAADVVQACVATLEPVRSAIAEDFQLIYAPPGDEAAEEEVELVYEEEDPPEPIIDGAIDIGEAVAEHLALALDPFPRASGATFDQGLVDAGDDATAGPFAALAALKPTGSRGSGEEE